MKAIKLAVTVATLLLLQYAGARQTAAVDDATFKALRVSRPVFEDFKSLRSNPFYASLIWDNGWAGTKHWRIDRYTVALGLAVSIGMVERSVERMKHHAMTDDLKNLTYIRDALPTQIELAKEFSAELKDLGSDGVRNLRSVNIEILNLEPRDEIDIRPGTSAIADDIQFLANLGVLVGKPVHLGRGNSYVFTSSAYAVAAHATYAKLLAAPHHAKHAIEFAKDRIDQEQASAPLLGLWKEFPSELIGLGEDNVPAIERQIEEWGHITETDSQEGFIAVTPANAMIYKDLNDLDQKGLLLALERGDRGERLPSRYDAAVATHATYLNLKQILKAKGATAATRELAQRSFFAVNRLAEEFQPELKNLGVDTGTMLADITRYLSVTAQDRAPLIPERIYMDRNAQTEWIFESQDRMKKEGLLVGYPDGLGGRAVDRWSNYALAVSTHATFVNMGRILANDRNAYLGNFDYAMSLTQDVEDLQRLATYFAPELRALGEDFPEMKKTIFSWRRNVEDMWSADNMVRWAKPEPPEMKTPLVKCS